MKASLRRAVAVVLFTIVVLATWLFWESYKCTVNWSKRHELFPLPFYILKLPHWFVVDLAIALIIFSSLALTIMVIECQNTSTSQ